MRPLLRYSADRRTLVVVAIYFLLATGAWFVPWTAEWIVPTVVLNALFAFFCAVITHNTIHCPVFVSKPLNRVFQLVLSLSYGHPVSTYVAGHNLSHHKYTQTSRDAIRTTKLRFRWNLLNQLFFFYAVAPAIVRGEAAFIARMKKDHSRWYKQYRWEAALVFGVTGLLLVLDWQRTLLFFVLPHHFAAWGVVGTNYWQHDGCDETHPYNHSRSFVGRFLNYLTFNNGYHGMHHMKPGVHWSLLPDYHARELSPHVHPNLERMSLAKYLIEAHISPGKRVDYLGKPVRLPQEGDAPWVSLVDLARDSSDLGAEQT